MRMLQTLVATLAIVGILAGPAWAKEGKGKPKKADAAETKKAKNDKQPLTAEQKAEKAKARQAKQFAKLDANSDNSVSIEEFNAKKFAALDANSDKAISLEEFSAPHKKAKGEKTKGKKHAGGQKKNA
ncbi:MAG: hypothetical protein K8T91_24765 [Planctomycetes bacterium]|nr:hypothetical protein [Planctomycetota bacterium]